MLSDKLIAVIRLLNQRPDRLNHGDPVGGLHACAFQFVVENRILIRSQVKLRRVLHHADTDMTGKSVGQKSVEVSGCHGLGSLQRRQVALRFQPTTKNDPEEAGR